MLFYVLHESERNGSVWLATSEGMTNVACFECLVNDAEHPLWELTTPERRSVMKLQAPLGVAIRTFLRKVRPFDHVTLRHVHSEELEHFRANYILS